MQKRIKYMAGTLVLLAGTILVTTQTSATAGPTAVPTQAPTSVQRTVPSAGTPTPHGPSAPEPGHDTIKVALDPGPATIPVGAPAIHPSLAGNSLVPAFTAQDVENYAQAHPTSLRDDLNSPATVDKVEFLPGGTVAARVRASTGRPDSDPLCLVTLRGAFSAGPPGGPATTSTTAFQVFDARTGNLLMEGLGA